MQHDLRGKTALVTGGSRGIGQAAALALAQLGMRVLIVYRSQEQMARQVVAQIEGTGAEAAMYRCDVSLADEVRRLADDVLARYSAVDVLVNNAGITRPQPLDEITEEDWDELLRVNLKSVFLVTQAFLPPMRARRWGRIINLSSVAAQLGGIVGPHYAASKAGIVGLTHSYATLLAAEEITVNAIAPALIETAMTAQNQAAVPSLIPLGRRGDVDEVASIVAMLAQNGYMTGQTISVNGGWYMTS
jgi:3-oxoacyl-[acyl-carrier protein] reductase